MYELKVKPSLNWKVSVGRTNSAYRISKIEAYLNYCLVSEKNSTNPRRNAIDTVTS